MNNKNYNILKFELLRVDNSIIFKKRALILLYYSQALKE